MQRLRTRKSLWLGMDTNSETDSCAEGRLRPMGSDDCVTLPLNQLFSLYYESTGTSPVGELTCTRLTSSEPDED